MKRIRIEISSSFAGSEIYDISEDQDKDSKSENYCLAYQIPQGATPYTSRVGRLSILESKVERIFEQCKDIRIGIIPDPVMGLDGTTTRVTIAHGFNEIQLTWWQRAPEQWRPVDKLIKKVKALGKNAKGCLESQR